MGQFQELQKEVPSSAKLSVVYCIQSQKVNFHPRRGSATYAGKKDELGRHYGELESVFDTSVLPERRSPTELLPA